MEILGNLTETNRKKQNLSMEQKEIICRLEDYIEYDAIMSPTAFAIKAGIDPSGFSKMLKGQQTITIATLKKISTAFGLNLKWLMNGEGEMFPPAAAKNAAAEYSYNENSNINDSDTINRLLSLLEEKDRQINQLLQVVSKLSK